MNGIGGQKILVQKEKESQIKQTFEFNGEFEQEYIHKSKRRNT